jgi:hypothetical protein
MHAPTSLLALALATLSLAAPAPQNPAEQGPDLVIGEYCPDKGVIWCTNANTKGLCGQDNTVYQLLHCVQGEGGGCVSTPIEGVPEEIYYPHCALGVDWIEGPN